MAHLPLSTSKVATLVVHHSSSQLATLGCLQALRQQHTLAWGQQQQPTQPWAGQQHRKACQGTQATLHSSQ
jgi:hypothetical protein